ncbi:hypothetical protein ACJX0J_026055, partial [Zea mays]
HPPQGNAASCCNPNLPNMFMLSIGQVHRNVQSQVQELLPSIKEELGMQIDVGFAVAPACQERKIFIDHLKLNSIIICIHNIVRLGQGGTERIKEGIVRAYLY